MTETSQNSIEDDDDYESDNILPILGMRLTV